MIFEGSFHPRELWILPGVMLVTLQCEECEEVHGVGLVIGWLFWEVRIGFEFSDE